MTMKTLIQPFQRLLAIAFLCGLSAAHAEETAGSANGLAPEVTDLNAKAFAKTPGPGSAGNVTPGKVSGDALLYDLNDSSLLGGITLQAKSSDKVKIRGNLSFMSDDLKSQLGKDFATKLKPVSDDHPQL